MMQGIFTRWIFDLAGQTGDKKGNKYGNERYLKSKVYRTKLEISITC